MEWRLSGSGFGTLYISVCIKHSIMDRLCVSTLRRRSMSPILLLSKTANIVTKSLV